MLPEFSKEILTFVGEKKHLGISSHITIERWYFGILKNTVQNSKW